MLLPEKDMEASDLPGLYSLRFLLRIFSWDLDYPIHTGLEKPLGWGTSLRAPWREVCHLPEPFLSSCKNILDPPVFCSGFATSCFTSAVATTML